MNEKLRILYLEDDADAIVYAKYCLDGENILCTYTNTVEQALQVIEHDPIDLILSDVQLENGDSTEFLRKCKQTAPQVPFIFLTAYPTIETTIFAINHGADAFITKPYTKESLLDTIFEQHKKRVKRRVLAIGAHPDDVEIGVGGSLLSHRDSGDTLAILTLSSGNRGGDSNLRSKESLDAANYLSAKLFLGDLTDTEISLTGNTVKLIEETVSEFKPTIVYIHTNNDRHQDHRNAHHASLVALRKIPHVFAYQSPSSTIEFKPSRYTDIQNHIDEKLTLLSFYSSQKDTRNYLANDLIRATARYWSRFTDLTYVEPLEVIRDQADIATYGQQEE